MTDTPDTAPSTRGGIGRFVPLIILAALALLFGSFLFAAKFLDYQRDTLPSALIGRPAPETDLPPLFEGADRLTTEALRGGGVQVVNVWASWCGPCRAEHPFIVEIAEAGIPVHGLNNRDEPANAKRFLQELGDPFTLIGVDRSGRASIDWGVYGVPETFVINDAGEIVYKHVGPIHAHEMESRIWPAIRRAGGQE